MGLIRSNEGQPGSVIFRWDKLAVQRKCVNTSIPLCSLDNESNNLQPCGSVRRVPTRIAVILGKRSLYNCSASRIVIPSPLGLPVGFLSIEFKSIEAGRALSKRGSDCLHENKSRLYVVAELSMKSSRVENGEGTGMYTAGIGFIGSHSGSLRAIAPAYR